MLESAKPNNYDDEASQSLIRQHNEHGRNFGALTVSRAASQQGAELEWHSERVVWARLNDRRVPIIGHYGPESSLSAAIVSNKNLAKELMKATGTPVPAGRKVESADDAISAQQEINGPIVVKPVAGAMGHGVTVNLTNPEDVRSAYERAAAGGGGVLVEQYVEGTSEYRAHATDSECVALFRRILPSVTGDGRSTIEQLVIEKNNHRMHNPTTAANPIPMDDVALGLLRRRGLTWQSVPALGETVVVRDVNGITSGGDSEECLDSASEALKQAAVNAVRAIPGMSWGGVDILVEDDTETPFVLEVNTDAATNGSTFPVFGTPRDVGSRLWAEIYRHSSPESTSAPLSSKALKEPRTLKSIFPDVLTERVSLQRLVMNEVERMGRNIKSLTQQIWTASTPGEPSWWFNVTLTGIDQRTSVHPIRRPLSYRQIMRNEKLPRPLAKRVLTVNQFQKFQDSVKSSVALIPLRKGLGRGITKVVSRDDQENLSALDGKHAWIAQARRRGHRFCVVATPEAALLVLSTNSRAEVSEDVLIRVSTLAVRAVRAMPQLRWAAVDIVHRFEADIVPNRPKALIEDISLNPSFRMSNRVIAGSFDPLMELITHGASVTSTRLDSEHQSE